MAKASANDGEDIPALPVIIGTSIVNGVAQVHIKRIESRPVSLKQGDISENGWLLKRVNLSGVVFQNEGVEQFVPVREYHLTSDKTTDERLERKKKTENNE